MWGVQSIFFSDDPYDSVGHRIDLYQIVAGEGLHEDGTTVDGNTDAVGIGEVRRKAVAG